MRLSGSCLIATFNALAPPPNLLPGAPKQLRDSGLDIWIAVHERGVSILAYKSFDALDTIPYDTLKNFGSTAQPRAASLLGSDAAKTVPDERCFRLLRKDGVTTVVNLQEAGTESDVAFTIASYINAIVRREGIRSTLASINHVLSDHETNTVGLGSTAQAPGSRRAVTSC